MDKHIIAYFPEEQVYVDVISYGSYASKIVYSKDGLSYETVVLNEELDFIFSIEEEE